MTALAPFTQTSSAHDRRLHEVDDAARRAIVRKGLKATTLRDISREGGFTTGVLTHYFADKEALIFGVLSNASDRWIGRARAAFAAQDSAEGLLHALLALSVPESEEERREWRLWTEMWSYAAENPEFAAYIVAADALWEHELREVLRRAVGERLLPKTLDVPAQAQILARLIDGVGIHGLLTGLWPHARTILVAHLASLGLPSATVKSLRIA